MNSTGKRSLFGNDIDANSIQKAMKIKSRHQEKVSRNVSHESILQAQDMPELAKILPIKLVVDEHTGEKITDKNTVVLLSTGSRSGIKSGFAVASSAVKAGFKLYFLDLTGLKNKGSLVLKEMDKGYDLSSRTVEKSLLDNLRFGKINDDKGKLFFQLYADTVTADITAESLKNLPKKVTVIALDFMSAQAAVAAGYKNTVSLLPAGSELACNLCDGALNAAQSVDSYVSYKLLKDMSDSGRALKPIPDEMIAYTGRFIDQEILQNFNTDSKKRILRISKKNEMRIIVNLTDDKNFQEITIPLIKHLMPYVKSGKFSLLVYPNASKGLYERVISTMKGYEELITRHTNFKDAYKYLKTAAGKRVTGVHFFYGNEFFESVVLASVITRLGDLLISSPDESVLQPVPKLIYKGESDYERSCGLHVTESGEGYYGISQKDEAIYFVDEILKNSGLMHLFNDKIIENFGDGLYGGAVKALEAATGKKIKVKR